MESDHLGEELGHCGKDQDTMVGGLDVGHSADKLPMATTQPGLVEEEAAFILNPGVGLFDQELWDLGEHDEGEPDNHGQ